MNTITLPRMLLVGLEVEASWQDLWVKMPKAWSILPHKIDSIPHRMGDVMIDVSLGVERDIYHQFIGCEVRDASDIPDALNCILIPEQPYLHHRHEGALRDIANGFGALYDHARAEDIEVTEFKIDVGYRTDRTETPHDLYVGMEPEQPWERIS